MKKNIIILGIGVLLIFTGLIYQKFMLKDNNIEKNETSINNSGINNNIDNILDDEIIFIDDSYRCNLINQANYSHPNLDYKTENYYYFDVKDEKVFTGYIEKRYVFQNKEAYDSFQYNEKTFSIKPYDIKFEEENLVKSYFYFLILNGNQNNISEYLENLKSQNYICEKITSDS